MPTFIDEILKGVADNESLSSEMSGVCALQALLDEYREYRSKYDATLPLINEESTGRDLKEAFIHVPPKVRLNMFSNYISALDRGTNSNSINHNTPDNTYIDNSMDYNNSDYNDINENEMKDVKDSLLKLLVYSFLILGIFLIVVVIYMAFAGIDNSTGSNVFITFLNGIVEILRVLFGI